MAPARLIAAAPDWLLPAILSTTAGAVDVIGFLALRGLLAAHITGNLVLAAAHAITGRYGRVGPLLALPVFIAALGAVALATIAAERAGYRPRRGLLVLQAALLATCLALAAAFGPSPDGDGPMPVLIGMFAVAAMATQNALVRLALPGSPSTAVMTTNTTQLTIDLAMLARRHGTPEQLAAARRRARLAFACLVGFLAGCAAGAALEVHRNLWALAFPLALAIVAIPLGDAWHVGRAAPGDANETTKESS